jgi:hypothetical protein
MDIEETNFHRNSGHGLKVNREVSFNEVVDLTILREAQRELGIK